MKFLDVNQHLSELDEHISVLKSYGDVFEVAEARITRVINMDGAFKGEGAKGVIYNHAHMQLPTIRSIRAFLISFSETLEKMKANINEYEPASNGSVSEDFWKNQLPKGYDRYEETLEEREAAINQATAEVSHILHLGKLQTGDVYNSVDSARKHADTVLEGLYDLDQAGVELMAQVRTKMEELKATIRQVLDWTITGGVTMKGVSIMEVGGYFANNATLHEKAPEVDTSRMSVGVHDPALADNPALVAVRLNKPGLAMHYRAFPIGFTYSSMMNRHRQYALDPLLYYMSATMTSGHPFVLDRMNKGFPLSARMHQQYVVNACTKEEILRDGANAKRVKNGYYKNSNSLYEMYNAVHNFEYNIEKEESSLLGFPGLGNYYGNINVRNGYLNLSGDASLIDTNKALKEKGLPEQETFLKMFYAEGKGSVPYQLSTIEEAFLTGSLIGSEAEVGVIHGRLAHKKSPIGLDLKMFRAGANASLESHSGSIGARAEVANVGATVKPFNWFGFEPLEEWFGWEWEPYVGGEISIGGVGKGAKVGIESELYAALGLGAAIKFGAEKDEKEVTRLKRPDIETSKSSECNK